MTRYSVVVLTYLNPNLYEHYSRSCVSLNGISKYSSLPATFAV